ncbi:MAG: hypothetical protein H7329_04630, partial [Opitutaceae bacterium]|nr:hypothetical protein [Cytophagales bacterium]
MKIKFYPYLITALLSSFTGHSQNAVQKIYPGNPSGSGFTSYSFIHDKGTAIDDQTIVIADFKACVKSADTCRNESGSVTIYKRDLNSVWQAKQVLTSPSKESKHFGGSVSLYGNMLAITSEAEYRPDMVRSGAIYFYRRSNATADFELVTKVHGEDPFL